MKLGSTRSDVFAVQYLSDNRIELDVTGYVWKLPNADGYVEFYFDKYPHIGYVVNWLQRYNQETDSNFTVLEELKRYLGGREGFVKFKRDWARAHCPRILKSHFKVTQAGPLNGWNSIIKNQK